MFLEKSLNEYFAAAASNEEVPGGGSISAAVGTLGACMASMAANFTLGKKKYAEVEDEIKELIVGIEVAISDLKKCIEKDSEAFLKFNDVYAMPNSTDEEKAARTVKMQETLKNAMQPPYEIMKSALEAMTLLPRLAEIGNQNLISDTGVAAIMLKAAIDGARLNVLVNIRYIKDDSLCNTTAAQVAQIVMKSEKLAAKTLKMVEEAVVK